MYGQPDELEQLLDRAVLAAAAVERDERDVGLRRLEPLDEVGADVDRPPPRGPSRSSASWTWAAERSETLRSSERPPLSSATRLTARACAAAGRSAARRRQGRARRAAGARLGRLRPGERPVERDLLGDDLADPPHALADVVLADAREVQPHRRAAAAVEVRGPPGDERDVLLPQRPRQQVGGVDVVGQRRPDEQPALRAASRSPRAGSARRARRASCRAGAGRARSACRT